MKRWLLNTEVYPQDSFWEKLKHVPNEAIDTIIINVLEIDTTQYNKMFSFWQRVEIGQIHLHLLLILIGNGKPEIYGYLFRSYSTALLVL